MSDFFQLNVKKVVTSLEKNHKIYKNKHITTKLCVLDTNVFLI